MKEEDLVLTKKFISLFAVGSSALIGVSLMTNKLDIFDDGL